MRKYFVTSSWNGMGTRVPSGGRMRAGTDSIPTLPIGLPSEWTLPARLGILRAGFGLGFGIGNAVDDEDEDEDEEGGDEEEDEDGGVVFLEGLPAYPRGM